MKRKTILLTLTSSVLILPIISAACQTNTAESKSEVKNPTTNNDEITKRLISQAEENQNNKNKQKETINTSEETNTHKTEISEPEQTPETPRNSVDEKTKTEGQKEEETINTETVNPETSKNSEINTEQPETQEQTNPNNQNPGDNNQPKEPETPEKQSDDSRQVSHDVISDNNNVVENENKTSENSEVNNSNPDPETSHIEETTTQPVENHEASEPVNEPEETETHDQNQPPIEENNEEVVLVNENRINQKGKYFNPALFEVSSSDKEAEGFNYGTAPLIHKKNSALTEDDLIDMFNYIAGNGVLEEFSFGDRQISSNLMSGAYARWINDNWINFPAWSLASGSLDFHRTADNNTVTGISHGKYASNWYTKNALSDSYKDFVRNGLNKIKDGMKDYEKAYALWLYTLEYFKYDISRLVSTIEKDIFDQLTVCAVYASSYGYLLNLVGIEAIANITGKLVNGDSHLVVYIKLQLPGDDKPKWYLSDATWGDAYSAGLSPNDDNPTIDKENTSYQEFLSPIGVNLTEPIFSQQFSDGAFWRLNWDSFKNTEDWHYGPYKLMKFDKRSIYGFVYENSNWLNLRSRYEYYNGKWYTLAQSSSDNKKYLYKRDFYSPYDEEYRVLQDVYLTDLFTDPKIAKGIENAPGKPMLASSNDNLIFYGKSENQNYFAVVNLSTNQTKVINIPNSENKEIGRYYLKNKNIYYSFAGELNTIFKLDLTDELKTFIFEKQTISQFELEKLTKIIKNEINLLVVGDSIGQINYLDKLRFIQYLDKVSKTQNTSAQDLKVKYNEVNAKYDELVKNLYKTNKKLLFTTKLPNQVRRSEEFLRQYGYNFEGVSAFINYSDLLAGNNSVRYDLMFSETENGTYQNILTDIEASELRLNSKVQLRSGFYKIKAYLVGNSDNFAMTNSVNIIIDSNAQPSPLNSGLVDQDSRYINIDSRTKELIQNNIQLNATVSSENNFSITAELGYISLKDQSKKVIQTYNNITSSTSINHTISQINSDNSGIYYIKVIKTQNNSQNVSNSYLKYYYVLDQETYSNKNQDTANDKLQQMLEVI
ncbi:hypothetical protein [Mycoplasma nasistruthionis]|uniref:Uncharacterized protein n=1 Tax=Mycoplasma nasistruthionis TaxID=353852 RepID=A0A5B7XVM0_9MOLU|nr:hypothetical protein [Mycoplasma nasistruthionis]QCZ36757.1 hypothetical protein FG904_01890 [Mycoplasma nasistruthionis]